MDHFEIPFEIKQKFDYFELNRFLNDEIFVGIVCFLSDNGFDIDNVEDYTLKLELNFKDVRLYIRNIYASMPHIYESIELTFSIDNPIYFKFVNFIVELTKNTFYTVDIDYIFEDKYLFIDIFTP